MKVCSMVIKQDLCDGTRCGVNSKSGNNLKNLVGEMENGCFVGTVQDGRALDLQSLLNVGAQQEHNTFF